MRDDQPEKIVGTAGAQQDTADWLALRSGAPQIDGAAETHALADDRGAVARAAEVAAGGSRSFAILNTMSQMVWSADAEGIVDFYNDSWHEFCGLARGAPLADRWTAFLHPDDQAQAWQQWQRCLAEGNPCEAEYRLRRHDGEYRWMLCRAVPIRAADGTIDCWCATFTDIHQLKDNEGQLSFEACELAHRLQNIFAVVQGLLMLSSSNDPDKMAFAESACARIKALARANDYIRPLSGATSAPHPPITLHGLFETLLSPYRTVTPGAAGNSSIEVSGADMTIGRSAATALALAIHELATNAAKYGALSRAGGALAVATVLDDQSLRVTWTETGGPVLAGAPARLGHGTMMTERALRLPLGAEVRREWAPAGLIVTIAIERDRLSG